MPGPRTIMHVDMDAFYASIEMLDHPELREQPVVVGSDYARGVVAAASYTARAFGIHSAMPMGKALRLCPQVVVLPVRMAHYQAVSRQIMTILARHTPTLEQVSVDEAYLDLTDLLPEGRAVEQLGHMIQAEVLRDSGLTCSIGVASAKAVAKMASDLRKPRGLVVIPPGEEAAFLAPLPIGSLRGVGTVTEQRLRDLGIRTIGDLTRLPLEWLVKQFGMPGHTLWHLARGIDESAVVPERQAKSLGRETTFASDVRDRLVLESTLHALAVDLAACLGYHRLLAGGVTLKVRDSDFSTRTRAQRLSELTDRADAIYAAALLLLQRLNPASPIRLLGITAGPLLPAAHRQLTLCFPDEGGGIDARR